MKVISRFVPSLTKCQCFSINSYSTSRFNDFLELTDEYLEDAQLLRNDFLSVFDELVEFNVSIGNYTTRGEEYVKDMTRYNVPHGKFIRALTLIKTYIRLNNDNDEVMKAENLEKVFVLGWAVEWLQSMFLVADDIMDRSEKRRGQDCWYRIPDVQERAISDAFLLENQVYEMIDRFYINEPEKSDRLQRFFRHISLDTIAGQLEDLYFNNFGQPEIDLGSYNLEIYEYIVLNKTAKYTVHLPVAAAMIASDITDETLFDDVEKISYKIGSYFQIQDDYLDVFGDYSKMGKVGRDIEEGKCSWVVCTALSLVNDQEMEVLELNFGKEDPKKVKRVKDLFVDLGIEGLYEEFEENVVNEIKEDCSLIDPRIAGSFLELLDLLYKRQK